MQQSVLFAIVVVNFFKSSVLRKEFVMEEKRGKVWVNELIKGLIKALI